MGLFEKKQDNEMMEEQIRILATNVETLNQKLIQDPTAAITPGEAVIRKQTSETLEHVKGINETLKTRQDEIKQTVSDGLTQVRNQTQLLQRELQEFPKQREELSVQIHKLNETMTQLSHLDKKFIKELVQKIDVFNTNAYNLNQNLVQYHKEMVDLLNQRINEIGENVANKLVRTSAFFIGGLVFLAILMALVFSKLFA